MNTDLKKYFINNPNHHFEKILISYFGRSGSFLLHSNLDRNQNILNTYPFLDRIFYLICKKANNIDLKNFSTFFKKNFVSSYLNEYNNLEILRANSTSFKISEIEKEKLFFAVENITNEIINKKIKIVNRVEFYFNLLYVAFSQIINFELDSKNLKFLLHFHNAVNDSRFDNVFNDLSIKFHLVTLREFSENFIAYKNSLTDEIYEQEKGYRPYFIGINCDTVKKFCTFSFILNLFSNQISLLHSKKNTYFIKIEDQKKHNFSIILSSLLLIANNRNKINQLSFGGQLAIWVDKYNKQILINSENKIIKKNKKKNKFILEELYTKYLMFNLNKFFTYKSSYKNKILERFYLINYLSYKFLYLSFSFFKKETLKNSFKKSIFCIIEDIKSIKNFKKKCRTLIQYEKY